MYEIIKRSPNYTTTQYIFIHQKKRHNLFYENVRKYLILSVPDWRGDKTFFIFLSSLLLLLLIMYIKVMTAFIFITCNF